MALRALSDFEQELETFRIEEEAAQQSFFAWLSVRNYLAQNKDALAFVNRTPMFWLTTNHSLLVDAFVSLGRIFDQGSKHNLDKLLRLASKDMAFFTKKALAGRKEVDGISPKDAAAYVSDKHEVTVEDFRRLRKEAAIRRRIYESRYRDIRDKVFAHNEVGRFGGGSYFANTNIEEMKELFAFLSALNDALWELTVNGRRPTLNVRNFILPPAPPSRDRGLLPGEQVAREVSAMFASVIRS